MAQSLQTMDNHRLGPVFVVVIVIVVFLSLLLIEPKYEINNISW
jgi:hypothetical protein